MLWDEIFQPLQDLPKLNRAKELLSMHEELKDARKIFESDEQKLRRAALEADETDW